MAKITDARVKELQAKFTDEQLSEIAEKFGKVPNSYTKSEDIIAAGFLTREEFEALPICPRTGEVTSVSSWPKIGGRKTYPLSGALNYAETVTYYEYVKAKRGGKMSLTSSGGKKPDEETQKTIDYLRENIPEELKGKLEDLIKVAFPPKKIGMIQEMFGVETAQALKEKVNVAYVMFRGPNGEFADKPEPDGGKLFAKGFMPKYTLEQIKSNLAKLKEKGIDMYGCIVDLQ